MKNFRFCLPLAGILIAVLAGCNPDFQTKESGDLSFSRDTVFFDSLFTGFDSPTERLIVRNYTEHNILIRNIYFESGSDSPFEMIFDGLTGNSIQDFVLDSGDSVIVFISYVSDAQDENVRDRIVFQVGDQQQKVNLDAFAMDAVFWQDTVLLGIQTLDPTKKHVIDGYLIVDRTAQLIIPAGTQLYFTPRLDSNFNYISRLEVHGRLRVDGELFNEVVFQQTRYGEDYEETPGQWRGLRFYSPATNCVLTHAIIKNAVIGVEIDSIAPNSAAQPKVKLDRCQIRNMAGYGILGLGFSGSLGNRSMLEARSSLIHNCKEGTVYFFGGGWYQMYNCTMANYTMDFIRNSPQLGISNYYEAFDARYQVKADFINCIIWGSEEEEYAFDTMDVANLWDVTFRNCMVRTSVPLEGSGNLTGNDPDFPQFYYPTKSNPAERLYWIHGESPGKDAGMNSNIQFDLKNEYWNEPYDMGAYQAF